MDTMSYLLGKKSGGGSGGTTNYNELTNKPSINGVTLSGNKSSEDLGIEISVPLITIDMQDRLREETLNEVSEFITQNINKVVYINIVDGSVFQSSGYIYIQNTINNYTPTTNSITSFGTTITTASIQGSWSNNEYTVSEINSASFDASKSLSTTNTAVFTPTSDYQPATKKYVDDNAGGGNARYIIKGNIDVTNGNFTNFNTEDNATVAKEIIENFDTLTLNDIVIAGTDVLSGRIIRYFTLKQAYKMSTNLQLIFETIDSTSSSDGISYCYKKGYNLFISFNSSTSVVSSIIAYDASVYALWNKNELIGKNNTTAYTPTGDYNPATKKYVDDKIITYSGYDATKTQTLKNVNGVLTWIDD